MFTSQQTWEGKSLTSVTADRVHPSSRHKAFIFIYFVLLCIKCLDFRKDPSDNFFFFFVSPFIYCNSVNLQTGRTFQLCFFLVTFKITLKSFKLDSLKFFCSFFKEKGKEQEHSILLCNKETVKVMKQCQLRVGFPFFL